MIHRYFTIANFLLITVGVYLCVNAFYTFVTARLDYGISAGVTINPVSSSPVERSHLTLADYAAITKRNIFNSSSGEVAPVVEKEKIDLREVIKGCIEGYQMAYPDIEFELDVSQRSIFINGVPEYIAQLMDKLIANAVEFSFENQKIRIFCHAMRDHAIVKVINHGPYLPEEMKDRLFDSMISVRPQEKQKQPHLGMGLHIARLISDFHGGQIRAENLSDAEGVAITVVLPLFFK